MLWSWCEEDGLWFEIECENWCVGNGREGVVTSGGNVSMAVLVEELRGGILADSLMVFVEGSGKTSHIVFHSLSISTKSFCRLASKEEVVKVIEALID